MALDPARRRRNLPTGDFKPDFESPPGYHIPRLMSPSLNLFYAIRLGPSKSVFSRGCAGS